MDNSGSAFPSHEHFMHGDKIVTGKPYGGLTKREYIAIEAMKSLIITAHELKNITRDDICNEAFEYADAMIAASKEKSDG